MGALIALSEIIDGFYALNKTDKALAILKEIRSGRYYFASKNRNFLIGNFKGIMQSLTQQEYTSIKELLLAQIPKLIEDRTDVNIAYSLLSQIIEYSYHENDFDVYLAYEREIFRRAKINKQKYLFHVITLAQTRNKLLSNIDNIEDFFIENYLQISRVKTINYGYLVDFTMNVGSSNKRKFLTHLFRCKPFKNDFIVKSFIQLHDELKKLCSLI